jgi:hypothetical protein
MRSNRKNKGKRSKNIARTIITTASVAPFALIAPFVAGVAAEPVPGGGGAVTVPSDLVTVEQPLSVAVSDLITTELNGSFQVGDSITMDLDEIFGDNSEDLIISLINSNPQVAEVTRTSGDLFVGGKNAGSTIVDLIVRKEVEGPSVHERFMLNVVSNDRITDVNGDGITIDDIVRYMKANSSKTFRKEDIGNLLGQIKPNSTVQKSDPVSNMEPYYMPVKNGQEHTVDVKSFFFDEDGDSLEYDVRVITSGSSVSASLVSGSILSVSTQSSVFSQTILNVRASDTNIDGEWQWQASKDIIVSVVNTPPVVEEPSVNPIVQEDESFYIEDFISASDADGHMLYYAVSETDYPSHGDIEEDYEANKLKYTPDPNYNGTDNFKIVVFDSYGGTAEVQFNVTVSPVDEGPIEGIPVTVEPNAEGKPWYVAVEEGNITTNIFLKSGYYGGEYESAYEEGIFFDPDGLITRYEISGLPVVEGEPGQMPEGYTLYAMHENGEMQINHQNTTINYAMVNLYFSINLETISTIPPITITAYDSDNNPIEYVLTILPNYG